MVVDNSALGKEANTSGKLAYCIDVYKAGGRKKHMPHATLGDKVTLQRYEFYFVYEKLHYAFKSHYQGTMREMISLKLTCAKNAITIKSRLP